LESVSGVMSGYDPPCDDIRGDGITPPMSLDGPDVARALFEAACRSARVVSTHVWLCDPSSATLRLVASAGPMRPDPTPVAVDEVSLGRTLRVRAATLTPVSRAIDGDAEATVYRFAQPIAAGTARAVAAIDVASTDRPDVTGLQRVLSALWPYVAACIAVHVASAQTELARVLVERCRALSRRVAEPEVLQLLLDSAMELTGAATGSVMMLTSDSRRLRIAASRGLPGDVVASTDVAEGEGIAGWVVATGRAMLVEDQPRRRRPSRRGVRSSVSAPIADEDGLLGVVNVGARTFPNSFTAPHMEALETLGRQTATALRNARALASSRELYFGSVRALALAMETKDPYAQGASDRVSDLAVRVARSLRLDDDDVEAVGTAGLLHDIGMDALGIRAMRDDVPLTTVESGLLRMHPAIAADILRQVPALEAVVPIVYHHHERFDGQGYVSRLSGDAIPIGARILAAADSFVAMTADRPFRRAMTPSAAIERMKDNAGTQFDPRVVEALVNVMNSDPAGVRSSE
jgi:HD-GYP domain-containing protein (c-di-GMP phosphodiesterase class II)